MREFRSYKLSISFYHSILQTKLPYYLQDQLRRASSSITMNLAEGSGKRTQADQKRYFYIALGSAREVKAITDLHPQDFTSEQKDKIDHICASIFNLVKWTST